jgi:hypothetical protein
MKMEHMIFRAIRYIVPVLFCYSFAGAQALTGPIRYEWQSPNRVTLTGDFKPEITLGDSVTLEISGSCDLRPWEEEKKRGGFLGIGAKRYKEIHSDPHRADQLRISVVLENTKYNDENGTKRNFNFNGQMLSEGDDQYVAARKVYYLAGFIDENGKNFVLGSANINVAVAIETIGRIKYIINQLDKEKPSSFQKIQDLLEMGNVLRQHPDQLAKEVVDYYQKKQPIVLNRIQQDLYEFLLAKAPSNHAIRSQLANVYVQNLEFDMASNSAKTVIAAMEGKEDDILTSEEKGQLGTVYNVLGEVSAKQHSGTQKNAFSLAAYYYGLSAKYYKDIDQDKYTTELLRQVKALQAVSSTTSLLQAADVLERFLRP